MSMVSELERPNQEMITMRHQPYPRRLYLYGEVIEDDPEATNSVVVGDESEEISMRALDYRKAHEVIESNGGNGGSSAAGVVVPHQGAVASASADPIAEPKRRGRPPKARA
jgi:hypothetical protein